METYICIPMIQVLEVFDVLKLCSLQDPRRTGVAVWKRGLLLLPMRYISSFLTLWLVSGNWVEKNKKALQKKRWVLLLNPSPWRGSLCSLERCCRYTSESSSFTGQPFAPHLYVLCSNSAFFRIRTRPCPLCLESGQQARVTSVAFQIL